MEIKKPNKKLRELTTEQLVVMTKKTKNVGVMRELETEIFARNEGFVMLSAKNVPTKEFEDFKQFSFQFFLRAIKNYEPGRGIKFSSYLIWWLRASVSTYNREKLSTMHFKKKIPGYNTPSPEAAHLYEIPGNGEARIESKMYLSDEYCDGDIKLEDILPCMKKNPLEEYADIEKSSLIKEVFANLSPREGRVLGLLFGINGKQCTLTEAGDLEDLSDERIRQIRDSAFRNIKSRYKKIEDINKRKKDESYN